MAFLSKQTDEFIVDSESEANALIERFKQESTRDGYAVVSYTSTLKEKKANKQVVDSYYVVKISKRWDE